MIRLQCLAALAVVSGFLCGTGKSAANDYPNRPINRFYHYPYYYFPHNYWPNMSAPWPEKPGMPYQKPPAYMAYPPFLEPGWRYDLWQPHYHHRGFHYWLDQF